MKRIKLVYETLMYCGVIAICLSLAGCNTIKGIGQDIIDAAQWTQDAVSFEPAPEVQDYQGPN